MIQASWLILPKLSPVMIKVEGETLSSKTSDDYLPITTCNALNVIELTRKRDHATFHHLHRVSVLRDVAEVRVRLAAAVVAAAAAAVLAV